MKRVLVAIGCLLALSTNAYSAKAVSLDSVLDLDSASIGGSGCVGGEASLRIAGRNILELRTPQMVVRANASQPTARKVCSLAIPFQLPANMRLVVTGVKLGGAVVVTKGASVNIGAEIFTAGAAGPTLSHTVKAPPAGKVTKKLTLNLAGISTACGEAGNLRLNLSETVKSSLSNSSAALGGALLGLQLQKCR